GRAENDNAARLRHPARRQSFAQWIQLLLLSGTIHDSIADYADGLPAKAESIVPHSNASRARKYDQKSHYLSRQRTSSGEFAYFVANAIQRRFLGAILQRFRDQVGNLEHFFFFHAARGHGRGANANAARFER